MHRCLAIPEIVDNICSQFKAVRWIPTRESSNALAALARTSLVFQKSALDRLWARQDTPFRFLRLMPPDLIDFGGKCLRLLRPILATDWERPLLYAHRIKILVCTLKIRPADHEVWTALGMSLPHDGPLFPNLVDLTWFQGSDTEFHFIDLFLTPRITSISLACGSSTSHMSILSTLPRKCPALKCVKFSRQWKPMPGLSASLRLFMDGLPNVESIGMSVPDVATLEHLGRAVNLKSLTLHTLPYELVSSPPADVPYFVSLNDIHLRTATIEMATKFFRMCRYTSMSSISVKFTTHERRPALKDFYASLAACHQAHSAVVSLSLGYKEVIMPEEPADVLDTDALRNLCYFTNLRDVSIATPIAFDLDDADIAELARSWRRLHSLALITQSTVLQPRATLHCLQCFAEHCPELHYIRINLDATIVPVQEPNARGHVAQPRLTNLNVAYSPISTPLPVARFISGIFPNLRSISTHRDDSDRQFDEAPLGRAEDEDLAIHDRWKEVEAQIPIVQAIRDEALLWAQQSI
ncbi:hypothetical protein B0H11DRAFT_1276058 [Mycena galericulata]|nr:hypothetical protein B0H11DRAFT_1276058 [Mycena galericulata]